jgi:hypothetical protein
MSPTTAEGMWLQKFLIVIIGRRLGHFETNKHASKSTFLNDANVEETVVDANEDSAEREKEQQRNI